MIEREVVYFIRVGEAIKVGRSTNMAERVSQFRTQNAKPITVIGVVAGGAKLEKAVHRELDAFRIEGEWFEDDPLVQNMIDIWLTRGMRGEDRAINYTNPRKYRKTPGRLNEKAFVDEAVTICDALLQLKRRNGLSIDEAIEEIALETGIASGTIWNLRYRAPNYITAATAEALRARMHTIKQDIKAIVGTG